MRAAERGQGLSPHSYVCWLQSIRQTGLTETFGVLLREIAEVLHYLADPDARLKHEKFADISTRFVNPAQPDQALLYRDLRWETLAFQTMFVLIFGGIGFGMLVGGLLARGKQKVEAALAAAHPEAPWMWRRDWAADASARMSFARASPSAM